MDQETMDEGTIGRATGPAPSAAPQQLGSAPAAGGWAWCPTRELHLRRTTDQETGEERWEARAIGLGLLDGAPPRPEAVPPAAVWDDQAKLWVDWTPRLGEELSRLTPEALRGLRALLDRASPDL